MEFSRQEYWCGLPFPSPGDLLDPGIEPGFPKLETDSLLSESPGKNPSGPCIYNVDTIDNVSSIKGRTVEEEAGALKFLT